MCYWERQRFPPNLSASGRLLTPPNKVYDEPPDLAAHLGIRVSASGQVPYRSEKDMVRNQNPSCQREGIVAPDDELALESKHHRVKVCLWGQVETHLDPQVPRAFPFRYPF
ncbi:unnamed protein product [Sphagnum balticum]